MIAALELLAVRKSFGPSEIIRGVDLKVEHGERHAIIGPNGAGKSTLFNLISGRVTPSSGRILLDGIDIAGQTPYEIKRRGLSRSFQITNIFPKLTVHENLRCALMWSAGYRYSFWHDIDRMPGIDRRIAELLDQVGLAHRAGESAGLLSYAEQRALEIGLTISSDARVILLDEPTAGMSRSETLQAVALIRRVTDNRTLLVVEHDMGVVFELADRISVLVHGTVLATDTPAAIRGNRDVQEAYLGTGQSA
jgi:branched-chain amino acid transport system ATP-binding protein